MISHFFIDRPIFAAVLSILITLTGGIALLFLPVAQYPQVIPPSIQVSISYPGASAEVVADTVAAPVEQQVNGVEGMLYMSSQMGNDGSYSLTVTFDLGTDLNTALVMVQNRVALAMPQLPNSVQRQGITIRKRTPDILMVINFTSPDGRYDDIYLSNYVTINIRDELLRLEGVSDLFYMGERDYSIRAWLDPQKLASLRMTPIDVANAVRTQNVEMAGGQVGQPPAPRGQPFQLPTDTLGRLTTPEQFGDIIVKVGLGAPAQPWSSAPAAQPTGAATTMNLGSSSSGGSSAGVRTGGPASGANIGGMRSSGNSLASTSTGTLSLSPMLARWSNAGTTTTNGTGGVMNPATVGGTTGSSASGTDTATATLTGQGTGMGLNTTGGGSTPGGAVGIVSVSDIGDNAIETGAMGKISIARRPKGTAASVVRLRDVARVELAAQNYNQACTFDTHPSVALGVHQLPGSNALDVADLVRQKMAELKARFPDGLDFEYAYDFTQFVRESIEDVERTLLEAVAIVAVVVLVFLQNWRAALIPLVAVPVAIIGTFAAMAALGFSVNNLTLFGLVLAIGIVVDDAIVVVENVERWLDHGLAPREATRRAMDEVTGPVVAVALVLCAVFVPCAFLRGITGQFFRQFAVTISVSTVISAFNSLTLSPALAAILLRPRSSEGRPRKRDPLTWLIDTSLGWFFALFNRAFEFGTGAYGRVVGGLLRVSLVVLLVYGGLLFLTYQVFNRAPTGFIPQQDMGRLVVNIQLPDSASQQRTQAVMIQAETIAHEMEEVTHTTTISGFSLALSASSSNFGSMFVMLKPFEKRRKPGQSASAIAARLQREYNRRVKEARLSVFGVPAIPGLSVVGGFKLMVEDRAGMGLQNLQRRTDELVANLRKQPGLTGVSSQFRSNTPQLYMDIDRTKVASLGVSFDEVDQTLGMYLGSLYVNSFNQFGRYWQVTLQAEGRYRKDVSDINLIKVRNKWGGMVPLGTLVNVREVGGPVMVTRYNLYPAAPITGNLAAGVSSGDAIAEIDRLAAETLPRSMGTEWTEVMFMQIRAGNTALKVFALAVVFVFLALAALYESWLQPLAVILVVPLCLLCSVAGVLFTHREVNIFVQIGLVVLVGLACKNSILIVEFAKQLRDEGRPRFEATLNASRLRLRPILMTSFAFILGVVPLVIATGAGAEMRRSLGTAVFSGMLGVTLFGVFLTPVFFYVIQGLGEARLFTNKNVLWAGTGLAGGLLGLATGYLLRAVGIVHTPWAPVVGGLVGAAGVCVVAGFFWKTRRMTNAQ